jgi:hypothetical protein
MKLCNENSECVYSKHNNSVYCRCLNNLSMCETTTTTTTTAITKTFIITITTTTNHTNNTSIKSINQTNNSIFEEQFERVLSTNNQTISPIYKTNFNYDHVYNYIISI